MELKSSATFLAIKRCEGIKTSGKAVNSLTPFSRGSGPFVPSIFLFCRAALFFWGGGSECEHQKTDRRRTKRGRVFDTMRIAPPHCRNFTIDLQQCWSINRKISNRQCTYYLIVRALTVADCVFFSCHHSAAITQLIVTFFRRTTFDVPIRVLYRCGMARRRGGMRVDLPFVARLCTGGDSDAPPCAL